MSHLHLDILRSDHTLKPTIDWCPKLRYSVQNENLFWYINQFLPLLYTLRHDITPPRVIPEMVQELQETPELATGDWFLYEDHTVIRVYGFSGRPYKLPAFLTLRIFALEYIRQKLACDEQHFIDRKLPKTFRIPTELGPFLVKNQQALSVVEERLNKMKFQAAGPWRYDPKGILFRLRNPGKQPGSENPFHEP